MARTAVDCTNGRMLGIDMMPESGWSDEIHVLLESRRCHRLVNLEIVAAAVEAAAASEAASAVAYIAAADNFPQDQHWSSAEIAADPVAAAAAPHPKRVPTDENRCFDCSAGSMPYKPRRWNSDTAGPAVGYY